MLHDHLSVINSHKARHAMLKVVSTSLQYEKCCAGYDNQNRKAMSWTNGNRCFQPLNTDASK